MAITKELGSTFEILSITIFRVMYDMILLQTTKKVVFLAFQKAQKKETKAVLNKLVTVEYVQHFTQIL